LHQERRNQKIPPLVFWEGASGRILTPSISIDNLRRFLGALSFEHLERIRGGDRLFSGIIHEIGRLLLKEGGGASFRLSIGAGKLLEILSPGDSICIDGACLTVETVKKESLIVYSSPETIKRTTLSQKAIGAPLNLEPSLSPTDRVHGHFVLGHVDGVGKVKDIKQEADSWRFSFQIPFSLGNLCVEKGSIAIDGISLTIAKIEYKSCKESVLDEDAVIEAAIIPFTYQNTTLQFRKSGDPVNVESDIFAKYAQKFLEPYSPDKGITMDLLRNAGFV